MKTYGPLQIYPEGLLGFFQLKNQGKNPELLSDTVIPTLDLRDWYFDTQSRNTASLGSTNCPVGTTGFLPYAVPLFVPENEYWWVNWYSADAVLDATETLSFAPAWRTAPAAAPANPYLVAPIESATGACRMCITNVSPFIVPPGAELGFWIQSAGVGTSVLTPYLRFAVLPI